MRTFTCMYVRVLNEVDAGSSMYIVRRGRMWASLGGAERQSLRTLYVAQRRATSSRRQFSCGGFLSCFAVLVVLFRALPSHLYAVLPKLDDTLSCRFAGAQARATSSAMIEGPLQALSGAELRSKHRQHIQRPLSAQRRDATGYNSELAPERHSPCTSQISPQAATEASIHLDSQYQAAEHKPGSPGSPISSLSGSAQTEGGCDGSSDSSDSSSDPRQDDSSTSDEDIELLAAREPTQHSHDGRRQPLAQPATASHAPAPMLSQGTLQDDHLEQEEANSEDDAKADSSGDRSSSEPLLRENPERFSMFPIEWV